MCLHPRLKDGIGQDIAFLYDHSMLVDRHLPRCLSCSSVHNTAGYQSTCQKIRPPLNGQRRRHESGSRNHVCKNFSSLTTLASKELCQTSQHPIIHPMATVLAKDSWHTLQPHINVCTESEVLAGGKKNSCPKHNGYHHGRPTGLKGSFCPSRASRFSA